MMQLLGVSGQNVIYEAARRIIHYHIMPYLEEVMMLIDLY